MTDVFLVELWRYHSTVFYLKLLVMSPFQSNAIPLAVICIFSFTVLKIFLFFFGFVELYYNVVGVHLVLFILLGVCFLLVSFGSSISSRKFIAIIFSVLFLLYSLFYSLKIPMAFIRHVLDTIIVFSSCLLSFLIPYFISLNLSTHLYLCLMNWLLFMLSSTHSSLVSCVFDNLCLWPRHHNFTIQQTRVPKQRDFLGKRFVLGYYRPGNTLVIF